MKLLVLEDDDFISQQIKTYFELNNHIVDIYNNGETLLNDAILESYDIFLFDINTPKKNGLDTLRQIRDDDIQTPAIFLTALSDIEFLRQGYGVGCNDYVKKPFNLEEIELRIMQLLHTNHNIVQINNDYKFDILKMKLFFQNKEIDLTHIQKDLLYILIKNIGSIVPSDIIIDYVWSEKPVCNNTLRTQIKKLRLKLNNNFIINIRNSGYKIDKQ